MDMNKKKDKKDTGSTIALNKRARHEYALEDRYEAGIALQGWEVKSLRQGRIAFSESYALAKNGELFLFGPQITPPLSASSHVLADGRRTPNPLLTITENPKLISAVDRHRHTLKSQNTV